MKKLHLQAKFLSPLQCSGLIRNNQLIRFNLSAFRDMEDKHALVTKPLLALVTLNGSSGSPAA